MLTEGNFAAALQDDAVETNAVFHAVPGTYEGPEITLCVGNECNENAKAR